jgi:hypothetical protein
MKKTMSVVLELAAKVGTITGKQITIFEHPDKMVQLTITSQTGFFVEKTVFPTMKITKKQAALALEFFLTMNKFSAPTAISIPIKTKTNEEMIKDNFPELLGNISSQHTLAECLQSMLTTINFEMTAGMRTMDDRTNSIKNICHKYLTVYRYNNEWWESAENKIRAFIRNNKNLAIPFMSHYVDEVLRLHNGQLRNI